MPKRAVVELANRMLSDLGEEKVANLVQDHHQDPAATIGDDQSCCCQGQHAGRPAGCGGMFGEPVNRRLIEDRHRYGDELGDGENNKRKNHAQPQIRPPLRPDERQQPHEYGPVIRACVQAWDAA